MTSRIQPLLALADLYQQVEQPEDVGLLQWKRHAVLMDAQLKIRVQ